MCCSQFTGDWVIHLLDPQVAGYDVSGATELSKAVDSGYVISNLTQVHCKYNCKCAMAYVSLTLWTWVWASSGSWWWTGKPGMLQPMGLQRVRHNWATELNWTEHVYVKSRKWFRWSYLQNTNRDTDAENKDTTGEWGNKLGDWDWHTYSTNTVYKISINQWEPTV